MPENHGLLSDEQLIALIRSGDSDAFAELSARYLALIRGKARLFEGTAAPEKEDLWQEGFLGLYVAATSYRKGEASFSTYAGVCVHNRMVSAARRHGNDKNRALNESLPLDSAEETNLGYEPGPEELVEIQENFSSMQQQIEKALTPLEKKVLSLYLSGCRRKDVPKEAGISLKAFDNALYRARSKLGKSE